MKTEVIQWINNYTTEKSRNAAQTSYNRLNKYLEESNKDVSDWINDMNISEDAKYKQLNLFCKSLDLMPASVRQYYSFIKSYIRVVHGIKTDIEDQKQFIKFKPIQKIERQPIQKDVIKDLCMGSNQVMRTFFLIQSSSGMRATESLGLKKENYEFLKDLTIVTIPANLTKTKTERITFISREAQSNLDKCIEQYFEPKKLNNVEWYFWKLRNTLGYTARYENSINYKINIHSFRAFTRTHAGKVNHDFAEALLGHEGYLRQYVRLEKDEKIAYYKKLEPKLRIF